MRRLGPRRKIVGEELIRPHGARMSELFEVLSCGHRQLASLDGDGLHTAGERCCKGCRDRLPKGPQGKVWSHTSFLEEEDGKVGP